MGNGVPGWLGLTDVNGEFNVHQFAMRQLLAKLRTAVLVKVIAVDAGAHPFSWTVDVQPLVKMVDGAGQSQSHGTIFGVQVLAASGANGAFSVKPAAGDMGLMVIADRDTSAAIAAAGEALPGSNRMHALEDGFYLGGFGNLNNAAHWLVADENGLTVQGNITITGNVNITGSLTASGQVQGNGVHLSTHTHTGVTTGGGTSGAPTPGS